MTNMSKAPYAATLGGAKVDVTEHITFTGRQGTFVLAVCVYSEDHTPPRSPFGAAVIRRGTRVRTSVHSVKAVA